MMYGIDLLDLLDGLSMRDVLVKLHKFDYYIFGMEPLFLRLHKQRVDEGKEQPVTGSLWVYYDAAAVMVESVRSMDYDLIDWIAKCRNGNTTGFVSDTSVSSITFTLLNGYGWWNKHQFKYTVNCYTLYPRHVPELLYDPRFVDGVLMNSSRVREAAYKIWGLT